jgi:glucose-6-phosphate 1-dehydrogenase
VRNFQPHQKPQSCALIIFGVTGDLTNRLVIPSLYNLAAAELLPERFCVVGVARCGMSNEALRESLMKGLHQFATRPVEDKVANRLLECITSVEADPGDGPSFDRLKEQLERLEAARDIGGNRLFYLATPPDAFAPIVRQLGRLGLLKEDHGAWRRLVIEKPFGTDLASARALNAELLKILNEHQIYRIDHYLGKETVQNILAFRLANGIFEPIWNRNYIDHVQITVAESDGVGRRGGYYDQVGAFRDMVVNHMLQLLSIVAMEPPVAFEAEPVRDEKLKVLKALRRIPPERTGELTLRGQYTAGIVDGKPVAGYRGEEKVAPDSWTETFVAAKLEIDSWRWAGTPFYLRHGKRLPRRITEIAIQFKRAPQRFFPGAERLDPNVLTIRIQPDEGISLRFAAKAPGATMQLQEVDMNFLYRGAFGKDDQVDAYERLLLDAMLGDRTLFTRADEVEQAWIWADDILRGFADRRTDVHFYAAGTWGPAWADAFIERDGRHWRNFQAPPGRGLVLLDSNGEQTPILRSSA